MPFDKVAQMREEIVSVQTNEAMVRRLTECMGACMEVAETAAECSQESQKEQPLQRCAFSTDGGKRQNAERNLAWRPLVGYVCGKQLFE
jgi:hypothetical protein